MAFPATPIDLTVEAAFGANLTADPGTWSWTDLSDRSRVADGIAIVAGIADEGVVGRARQLSLTLDNTDAALTPYNPTSTYFPNVVENTPIRVTVNEGGGGVRALCYVDSWPPRWPSPTDTECVVPITASGARRRLAQGQVAMSALRRTILAAEPTAYWTLEDGESATQAASAVTGGDALTPLGTVDFGGTFAPAGAASAAIMSGGGSMRGSTRITAGAVASWEAEICVGWSVMPAIGVEPFVIGFNTPGSTMLQWGIRLTDDGSEYHLAIYRTDGTTTTTNSATLFPIVAGQTYHFRIRMEQSGSDINYYRYVDGTLAGSGIQAATTLTAPTEVLFNPMGGSGQPDSICHVAIWSPQRSSATSYAAANGYEGELAHVRIPRLFAEEGVTCDTDATESAAMGVQKVGALLALADEATETDLGVLYDGTANGGFVYVSHTERENQDVVLELSTLDERFAPAVDDQGRLTDMTITRRDGSFGRYVNDAYEAARGGAKWADGKTLSLHQDADAYHQASTRVGLGTVEGFRYPVIAFNLAAAPSKVDDWMATTIGARIAATSLPTQHGPTNPDVVLLGYSEKIGQYEWQIEANCAPFRPWQVFTLAATSGDTSDFLGHLDWDSCVTAEALDTTETGVDVTTTPLITTAADDLPFDILIGGERMTVTACTGASNPQTLTVTRSVNGVAKSHSIGATVELHPDDACYLGL